MTEAKNDNAMAVMALISSSQLEVKNSARQLKATNYTAKSPQFLHAKGLFYSLQIVDGCATRNNK